MAKYDPLQSYLENQTVDTLDANFAQIESILGFSLPNSAYRHQAWWANEKHGSHSHARAWQDAGWETSMVNTAHRTVRFERRRAAEPVRKAARPIQKGNSDQWRRAEELTGIRDRKALINAALEALIQRETEKFFAEIGGSMPTASAAPRKRPFE